MTTNFVDQLDEALVRPGRADIKLKIDNADSDQISKLYMKFFTDVKEAEAKKFAKLIPKDKISMAAL